jgi:hypothetical protein
MYMSWKDDPAGAGAGFSPGDAAGAAIPWAPQARTSTAIVTRGSQHALAAGSTPMCRRNARDLRAVQANS